MKLPFRTKLLVPISSQMNLVHIFPHYFSKIHSSIFFLSMSSVPYSLFISGFPTNILYAFFISPMHATCPANFTVPDLMTLLTSATSINYVVPQYVIFFSLLLLSFSLSLSCMSACTHTHPHSYHLLKWFFGHLTWCIKYTVYILLNRYSSKRKQSWSFQR